MLAGCGGGGGGGVTPSPTTTTTVSTRVVAPTGGGARIAGRMAYASTVVTGATVEIITSDGNRFQLSHDGNGVYSAQITNLTSDFVIEARKGDLLLENMFSDISAGGILDIGETNATTTAYVEIAKTMINQMQISGLTIDDNSDFLSNLDNAQINVDFVELRADVVDGGDAEYTNVVTSYSAVLAAADDTTDGTGNSCLDNYVVSDAYQTQVVTVLENKTPPQKDNDKDSIRSVLTSLYSAYANRNLSTLSSSMSSSYLDDGYGKTNWLASIQTDDWADYTSAYVSPLSFIDIEVSGNYATATVKNSWTEVRVDNGRTEKSTSIDIMKMIKENGIWYWWGSQRKTGVYGKIEAVKWQPDGQTYWWFGPHIDETSSYPISSITMSGPQLSTAPGYDNGVVTYQKEEGENTWIANGTSWTWGLPAKPSVGDTYSINITFSDQTTATYYWTVRSIPDEIFPQISSPVLTNNIYEASGDFTISWTDISDSIQNFSHYYVSIGGGTNNFRYNISNIPAYTTSVSVSTTGMPENESLDAGVWACNYYDDCSTIHFTLKYVP